MVGLRLWFSEIGTGAVAWGRIMIGGLEEIVTELS